MSFLSQTKGMKTTAILQWIRTIIEPNDSLWFHIFISGVLFKAIFSFSFWSCDVLYGVDLWSALVGQTFETKVEVWGNISWFDTRFILVDIQQTKEISDNLLGHNLMLFYMLKQNGSENTQSLPIFKNEFTNDQDFIDNLDLAQDSPNPSDVVFLLTRNEYVNLGLKMKRQKKPFNLRISRKPVKSYAGVNERLFWNTLRHSLLNEPIARAILRLQVIQYMTDDIFSEMRMD